MTLQRGQPGQIVILGLVFMGIIALAAVSFVDYEGVFVSQSRSGMRREAALTLAEAGLNKAIARLNQTGGSYIGETLNFGGGTIVITTTDLDAKNKRVEATAYIPNQTAPVARRKVSLQVSSEPPTENVSFHYGVQIGAGGLEMAMNTQVTGNIYSNGSFQGAGVGKSTITGDAYVAGSSAAAANQQDENKTADFIFGKNSPQIDVGQSFRTTSTAPLTKAHLYLKKVGNPSDTTIYLLADEGGSPSKTVLAQAALRASLVTTSYGWIEAAFSEPYTVQAETDYWLMIDSGRDSNNYWVWGKDGDSTYARGQVKYSADWNDRTPVWTAVGADLDFRVWLGGLPTFIDSASILGSAHVNTITHSRVEGDAYFQTLNDTFVVGAKHSGSPDPAVQTFPVSDANIADWKQAAAAGGPPIEGDYRPGGEIVNLGPKKITGNLIIDNGQTLVLTGTVWVEGYISISNNGAIRLDPGYGRNSGVILTDKYITLDNNGVFSGSGHFNSFLLMVTLANCLGGTQTADCASGNAAVFLKNNVDSTVFYAPHGLIHLNNRVVVKEVTAYKMYLANNAEVIYDSGLASASFSNGPSGAWRAIRGAWQESP